jgi:pimeloyl-ACP methyl ester carboxylesterase
VPRAALDAPETAYMILRAGAALGGAETVLHEVRQELRAEGIRGMTLDQAMDLRREIYRLAMDGEAIEAADRLVEPYLDEPWYRAAFGDGPASVVWSETRWGWMQRNHGYVPALDVARFDGPVLWFLGELDQNVPFVSTHTALERAFAESPGNDEELVVIEDSPHSFIIPSEQGPSLYAEGFWGKMADWMAERGFTNEACWER